MLNNHTETLKTGQEGNSEKTNSAGSAKIVATLTKTISTATTATKSISTQEIMLILMEKNG